MATSARPARSRKGASEPLSGLPLSREQLLELSRLHGAEVYDRSIDVQILRLRRKIEADPATPRLIRTERGAGYIFHARVDRLA